MDDSSSESSDGFSTSRLRRLATADKARREVPRTAPRKLPVHQSDSDSDGPLLTPARRNVAGQGRPGAGTAGRPPAGTAGRTAGGGRLVALARSARRGSSSSSSSDGEDQRFSSSVQRLAARAVQQRRQQQQHMSGPASIASKGSSDGRAPEPPASATRRKWVPRGPLSSDDEEDAGSQQRMDTRTRRDVAAPPQTSQRQVARAASPAARPPVHPTGGTQADTRTAGMATKSSSFRQALASLRTSNAAGAASAAGASAEGVPAVRGASGAPSPASSVMLQEYTQSARRALRHTSSMPARTEQLLAGSGRVPSRTLSPRGSPALSPGQSHSGGTDPVGEQIRRSLSVTLEHPLGSPRASQQHDGVPSPAAASRHLGLPSPSAHPHQPQTQPQGESGSTSPQRPLSPSRLGRGSGAFLPTAHQYATADADASTTTSSGLARSEDEAGLPGQKHPVAGDLGQGTLQQRPQRAPPDAARQEELQALPYPSMLPTGHHGSPAGQAAHVGAVPAVLLRDAATSPVRGAMGQRDEDVQEAGAGDSATAFGPWFAAGGPGRGAAAHAAGMPPSPVRMGALSNTLMREQSAQEVAQPAQPAQSAIGVGVAAMAAAEAAAAAPVAGATGPAEASSSSPARLDYLPPISHITQQLEELLNHVNSALGHGGAGLGSPATTPLRAGLGMGFGLGLGPSPGAASQAPTEWYRPASPGLDGLARVLDTTFGRPTSPGAGALPPPTSLAALFPSPPPGADVQSVLRQLATVQRDVDALRRNVTAERAYAGAAVAATGSRPGTAGAGGGAGVGSVHTGWASPQRGASSPGPVSPPYGGAAPSAQSPPAPALQHQYDASSPGSYASSVSLLEQQQQQQHAPAHVAPAQPHHQQQPLRSFGSSFLTSGSLAATGHLGPTAASLRTLAAPLPRPLARIEPLSVVLPSRRRSVSPRAAAGMIPPLDNDPQQVDAIVEALGSIRHSLAALGDSVEGIQDIVAAGSSSAGSSPRRPDSRYGRPRSRYSHGELDGGDDSDIAWRERGGGVEPVDLSGLLPRGRRSRYGSPRRSMEDLHRDGIRYEGITDMERRSRSQSRSASPASSPTASPRQGRYEVDYGDHGTSSRPSSRGRAYAYRTALDATVAHLRAAGGLSPQQARAVAVSGQRSSSQWQRPPSPTASPSAVRALQLSPTGAAGRRPQAWDKYTDAGQGAAAAASPVSGLMVAMPAGQLRVHGSPTRHSPPSPGRSRVQVFSLVSSQAPAAAGRVPPAQTGGGHTTTSFIPRRQQAAQAAQVAHTLPAAAATEHPAPVASQQRASAAAAAPSATARAAATGRASGRPRLMPVEAIMSAFIDAARQAAAIEPLEALPAPNYVRTSVGGHGSPAGSTASRPSSPGGLSASALIADDGLVLKSLMDATAPVQRYTAADVLHTLAATPMGPQARGPPASVAASSVNGRVSRATAPPTRAQEEARDLYAVLQGMRTLPGAGGGGGPTTAAAPAGGGGGTSGGRSLSPSLAAMHAETRARLREAGLPVSRLALAGAAAGTVSTGRLSSTLGGGQGDVGGGASAGASQAGASAQRPLAPLSTSSVLTSYTPATNNIRRYGLTPGVQATPSTQPQYFPSASQARDRRVQVLPDTHVIHRASAGGGGSGSWRSLASMRPGEGPTTLRQAGTYPAAPAGRDASDLFSTRNVVVTVGSGDRTSRLASGRAMDAGIKANHFVDDSVGVIGSRPYSDTRVAQDETKGWRPSAATSVPGSNIDGDEPHEPAGGGAESTSSVGPTTHSDSGHGDYDGDAEQQLAAGAGEDWSEPGSNYSDGACGGTAYGDERELSFIALAPELRRQALARVGLSSSNQGSDRSSVEPPSSDLDSPAAWTSEAGLRTVRPHGSGAEGDSEESGEAGGASQEGGNSGSSRADSDGCWMAEQGPDGSCSVDATVVDAPGGRGSTACGALQGRVVLPPEAQLEPGPAAGFAKGLSNEEEQIEEMPSPACTSGAGTDAHADGNQVAAAGYAYNQALHSGCSSPRHEDSASSNGLDGEQSVVGMPAHVTEEATRGPATLGALAASTSAHRAAAQALEALDGGARTLEPPPQSQSLSSLMLSNLHAPEPASGVPLRGMLGLLAELDLVPDPQLDLNPNLHVELGLELGLVSHEALLLGQAGEEGLLGPLNASTAAAAVPSPQVVRLSRHVEAAAPIAEGAGAEAEAADSGSQLHRGALPEQPSLQRALEEELEAAVTPARGDAPRAVGRIAVREEIDSLEAQVLAAASPPAPHQHSTPAGGTPDADRAPEQPASAAVTQPAVQMGSERNVGLLQRLQAVAEESRVRQLQMLLASPALSLARERAPLTGEHASSDGEGNSGSHSLRAPGEPGEAVEGTTVLLSFGSEQFGSPEKLPKESAASVPTPVDATADRLPSAAPPHLDGAECGPPDAQGNRCAGHEPALVDRVEPPAAQPAVEPASSSGLPRLEDTGALQQPVGTRTPGAAPQLVASPVECQQPIPTPKPQLPGATAAALPEPPAAAADRTPAAGTAGGMWGFSGGGTAATTAAARGTTPRYAAVPDSPESPAMSSAMAASSGHAGGGTDEAQGETDDTGSGGAGQSESSAEEREDGSGEQEAARAVAPSLGGAALGPVRGRHDVGGAAAGFALQAGRGLVARAPQPQPAGILRARAPELHLEHAGVGSGAAPATPTAHGPVRQQVTHVGARSRTLLAGAAARSTTVAPHTSQPLRPPPQLQQRDVRSITAPPLPQQTAAPSNPAATSAGRLGVWDRLVAAPRLSWSRTAEAAPQGWQHEPPPAGILSSGAWQHEPPPAGILSSGAEGPDAGVLVPGRASFSLVDGGSRQEQVLRPRQEPHVHHRTQPAAHLQIVSGVSTGSAYETRDQRQRQSTSLLLASLRQINAITQSTCMRVCDVVQQHESLEGRAWHV
ncbi:hypothetical protein CHLRE_12g497800v5 [Chlamydomonas reinhardtii]|uniref:Uncharacterized protein n=1 Tax=Chlamydomonas reinhardtii TaxID=3055 RepID=A0A2K3D3F3_CHLRE|nr:uncharacterized protein CHLRE_12g497800v5 [Chlamydomonas reinhardtii]PNW75072.1 hypothetical protein CHLRE_12g497800v5 [Chlamydomonas reinhardtii]